MVCKEASFGERDDDARDGLCPYKLYHMNQWTNVLKPRHQRPNYINSSSVIEKLILHQNLYSEGLYIYIMLDIILWYHHRLTYPRKTTTDVSLDYKLNINIHRYVLCYRKLYCMSTLIEWLYVIFIYSFFPLHKFDLHPLKQIILGEVKSY